MTSERATSSPKKRAAAQSEAALDPFAYLMRRFKRARKPEEKLDLAFQLLPYVRPRLRAVELSQASPLEIVVEFGGDE